MLGRTDSRRRMLLLLITFVVVAASLIARLAYWQVTQRERLSQEAFAQTTMRSETPSARGDIYDRSGVVVLASTVDRERLAAIPSALKPQRRQAVAEELVRILRLEGDAAEQLTARMLTDKKYVVLFHGLDRQRADLVRAAATAGTVEAILLEPEPVRVYPHEGGGPDSTLAAQLLGFVNRDGEGQYGVEQYYQDQLAGRPRVVHAQRDVSGRPIPDTAIIEDAGTPGEDIRLTIDAGLQLALEQEVLAAWAADRAKSVSAVVIDPYTGEVLAEATYPSYDANNYQAVAAADPNRFIDPVVSLGLRARLGLQDADRDRGAGEPDGHDQDEDQGRRDAQARWRADPRRRRGPQGPRLDDLRGRDRLVAQRRRGEGRARSSARTRTSRRRSFTRRGRRWASGRGPGSTSPAR